MCSLPLVPVCCAPYGLLLDSSGRWRWRRCYHTREREAENAEGKDAVRDGWASLCLKRSSLWSLLWNGMARAPAQDRQMVKAKSGALEV